LPKRPNLSLQIPEGESLPGFRRGEPQKNKLKKGLVLEPKRLPVPCSGDETKGRFPIKLEGWREVCIRANSPSSKVDARTEKILKR